MTTGLNHAGAPKAAVLLSGGLDSATLLAVAARDGFQTHALVIDYGQRHRQELTAARLVAQQLRAASILILPLDLRAIGGSALTADIDVPKDRPNPASEPGIPVTYVPARNLIFLSLLAAYAETLGARDLFIGVNALDYSGYPDCRPPFIAAFQHAVNLATKAGVEPHPSQPPGPHFRLRTPLIDLTKADIVRLGLSLGVDFSLTHSCYDPGPSGGACARCDSCLLRARAFQQAGVPDPTVYDHAAQPR